MSRANWTDAWSMSCTSLIDFFKVHTLKKNSAIIQQQIIERASQRKGPWRGTLNKVLTLSLFWMITTFLDLNLYNCALEPKITIALVCVPHRKENYARTQQDIYIILLVLFCGKKIQISIINYLLKWQGLKDHDPITKLYCFIKEYYESNKVLILHSWSWLHDFFGLPYFGQVRDEQFFLIVSTEVFLGLPLLHADWIKITLIRASLSPSPTLLFDILSSTPPLVQLSTSHTCSHSLFESTLYYHSFAF